MTTPDMSKPSLFDLSLDLAPSEPLTPSARDARDAMLEPLRTRVVACRRRRLAIRAGFASVLAIAAIVGVQLLTTPDSAPARELVQQTPPPLPTAPDARTARKLTVERPTKFAITIITTDPTVLDRLSPKPPATPLITSLTDDELLDALQAAGTPGFIKINGKVVLSRDLFKPAEADANPQSRAKNIGDTHG